MNYEGQIRILKGQKDSQFNWGCLPFSVFKSNQPHGLQMNDASSNLQQKCAWSAEL